MAGAIKQGQLRNVTKKWLDLTTTNHYLGFNVLALLPLFISIVVVSIKCGIGSSMAEDTDDEIEFLIKTREYQVQLFENFFESISPLPPLVCGSVFCK